MTAAEPQAPSTVAQQLPPRRASWFQFSLRVVLLLTATIAIWTAAIVNRREIAPLKQRIELMRPLARELIIQDPQQIAVVKCEELWYDENEWEVYLPAGRYVLALATQQIDAQAPAVSSQTAPLPSGRFRLALTQERTDTGWRIRVTKDGEEILRVDEEPGWHPGHGSSGGGQFANAKQMDPAGPVELFRRRFSRAGPPTSNKFTSFQTPTGPCEGVLLTIERAPAKDSANDGSVKVPTKSADEPVPSP